MGPFLSSRGNKYILVVVDYFSKRVEAKALPTNDARVVCKFLKSLFARFGTPRAIISDRSMHFCNDQFTKVMLKYGVTHRLATAYHPQTSGQVEVSNLGLKRILDRTVGENHASCDFLLEEVDAFLALEDGPTSPEVDHSYYDTEEDILLLKAFLNNDPSLPPPTQGIVRKTGYVTWPVQGFHILPNLSGYDRKTMEVFMDDFSVFRNSFGTCLFHLEKMLQRCQDTNLCLNWEKSHFMIKEGIVLGQKISKNEIEVDKAKVDVIAKLPHPTTIKGIHSFLGHVGFY
nr:reverse transcriptase domain-containing protein [Tanacetum cinerariifolium]